jgi:hypothetical protein
MAMQPCVAGNADLIGVFLNARLSPVITVLLHFC